MIKNKMKTTRDSWIAFQNECLASLYNKIKCNLTIKLVSLAKYFNKANNGWDLSWLKIDTRSGSCGIFRMITRLNEHLSFVSNCISAILLPHHKSLCNIRHI